MQRLFSSFADGWPGAGLLIQRLLIDTILLYNALTCLNSKSVCVFAVAKSIAALAAILLIAGLWTPIAGILVTGVETWIIMSASCTRSLPLATCWKCIVAGLRTRPQPAPYDDWTSAFTLSPWNSIASPQSQNEERLAGQGPLVSFELAPHY